MRYLIVFLNHFLNLKFAVLLLLSLAINPLMAATACHSLYNQQFTTLQGKTFNLCDYQDKVIIAVNTASKCGFTSQFEDLEALYSKYKDKGLLIVGFPSNDFKQELSSDKQIGDFCKLTYAVKFPMMRKSSIQGENANPFYQKLITITGKSPQWNFYKYVILPQGKEVKLFESTVKPNESEIMSMIMPFLK